MPAPHTLSYVAVVATVAASVLLVTPPAAEARAGVHCGMRIKHSFTLHRNLHNCRGDGLVVRANNITINLAGTPSTAVSRRSTAGVRITGFHGVTVTRRRHPAVRKGHLAGPRRRQQDPEQHGQRQRSTRASSPTRRARAT